MALLTKTITWSEAWRSKSFRNKTFVALCLVAIILLSLPTFFAFIEKNWFEILLFLLSTNRQTIILNVLHIVMYKNRIVII